MYQLIHTKVMKSIADEERQAVKEGNYETEYLRGFKAGRANAYTTGSKWMQEAEDEIRRLRAEVETLTSGLHHARLALDDAWQDAYRGELDDAEWEAVVDGSSIRPDLRRGAA